MRICLHGYASGKVQGVGFRQHTAEQADRLDLDGWVKNLPDGQVEVLLEGEEEQVQELVAWLEQGPPRARVDALELSPQPVQGITGFLIRR